ncbi:unnamed protein product [Auanema sp. JU1783]|nr:unnamed protein product [Auanema sp. JU1783]
MMFPKLGLATKSALKKMQLKQGYFRRKWRKAKTSLLSMCMSKYRKCLTKMKKCIRTDTEIDHDRRKSSAKLQPLPDRPIRRVASKLKRRPTDELNKLRKKGEDWTANDLFRFQYSDPEAGTPEERRQLCYEWLDRLHDISKKYCYLAWYEAAIYACYYRLAPILTDMNEKKSIWRDVRQEYAEIFLMGRRIWRRPIHPSRLRVFYDMAMLCVRFGEVEMDKTIPMFRDLLDDATNFDFKVLNEVEFAKSIDKVTRLENFVIDEFYPRRRSSGSVRTSFRSRRNTDRSPSRRSQTDEDTFVDAKSSISGIPGLRDESDTDIDCIEEKMNLVNLTSSDATVSPKVEQKSPELKQAVRSSSILSLWSEVDSMKSASEEPLVEKNSPRQRKGASMSPKTEHRSLNIPKIVINAPSRANSMRSGSPRLNVRFEEKEPLIQ